MKRLLLILLVLLPFLVRGQNASWRFFDRYTKAEGFTSIQLERMMSRRAAEKGDRGLAELLGGIEYIRIVSLDKGDGAQFVADAERLAADPDLEFQLVMSGTEEGQTTKFYIREASVTDNSELLMLTCGTKETVVVNIYGEFDLKQVARLSSIRPQ